MDSVIQAPPEAIEHGLHIKPTATSTKALEDSTAYIRLPIAIGILEIKNLGRHTHKNSSVVCDHCGGPGKALGKNAAFLKLPISISIFQKSDSASIRILMLGVADHFHDIQTPHCIKAHGNGISHQRLSSRQLQIIAFLYRQRLACVLGRSMRDARQLLGIGLWISC